MSSSFRRAGSTIKVRNHQAGTASTTVPSKSDDGGSSSSPASMTLSSSLQNRTTTIMMMTPMKGVKPWHGGTYLTSVGLNDLDTILGGGQPLGTCILVEEDRWMEDLALSLVKYWCAEAISQDQDLIIPILEKLDNGVDPVDASRGLKLELEGLILNLPRNLHWDKYRKKRQEQGEDVVGGSSRRHGGELDVLAEEDDEDDDDDDNGRADDDEGLVVAWQYKMSVQKERLATNIATQSMSSSTGSNSTVFCHSYDLSGRITDQTTIDPTTYVVPLPSSTALSGAVKSIPVLGMNLFCDLVTLLNNKAVMSLQHGKATRLLLYHSSLEVMSVTLPLLLAYIRSESLPVVIMICTRPSSESRSWIQLSRASDVVLRTEGFASRKQYPPPAEFRHLQGVLKVDKTTKKNTEIAALIYGFKRDRRKLHIPLLHIPPEDYAEGGGSVGAGGIRSGAGRPTSAGDTQETKSRSIPTKTTTGTGCSSNISGSVLDF